MARLIDADNIISVCEILSEKGNNPHYWGQLISIIKDMPTIDAIPVKWIMSWSNKRYRETQMDVSIVDVLEAWQKKQ